MKTLHLLRSALFPLAVAASIGVAHAQTYDGSPYTAWASDYSGSEANTLLLWKFDNPTPRGNSAGATHGATVVTSTVEGVPRTEAGVAGGKFGEAFYIPERVNADRNYARITGSAATLLGTTIPALSVEFWFKPIDPATPSAYFVDYQFTSNRGMQLQLVKATDGTGSLSFSVGNGQNIIVDGKEVKAPGSTFSIQTGVLDWNVDQWYHVAVTFEEVGNESVLKVFRDGSLLASGSREDFGSMVDNGIVWRVGNRLGSNFSSMPGYMDNFRISNVAYQYAAIPEPSVAAILGLTGVGLLFAAKSRRKSRS